MAQTRRDRAPHARRHALGVMPAKAGIQYVVRLRLNNERLGLLGPSFRWDDAEVC
jgi:hypothetical protein